MSDVFLLVLSFLFPIIKAQGTLNVPELNSFGTVPGITTDFDGIYPLINFGLSPLTSIIFVHDVKTTFSPKTASIQL